MTPAEQKIIDAFKEKFGYRGYMLDENQLNGAALWLLQSIREVRAERNVERDEAIKWLQVVQPMVKGFAWEHQVGSNQKIAQEVETFLSSFTPTSTTEEE